MILAGLLFVPLVGGGLAWALGRGSDRWARVVCLAALTLDLVWVVMLWAPERAMVSSSHSWLMDLDLPWIPGFGIRFHLALDGLSLSLIGLTAVLGIVAVLASWNEIRERVGFFHFNLMWTVAGIIGVFLAMDLFLFYFFWELMLVPMYFLIGIWGHEKRVEASFKFFVFTQAGGLLMFLAILALAVLNYTSSGVWSFDYETLIGVSAGSAAAKWILLGFFVAFAVKLPVVPLHVWLPDAHTEAPTAGSVILAGVLLKTGGYGLIRFGLPLFPVAGGDLAPVAMGLAVVGILYGALMAFAQTDLKRLVAYTSVSHMGFVLLGIAARSELALQGALMQMICHGLATGALFVLVGIIQERLQTRDMTRLGGLWAVVPKMGAVSLFFAMASLGLPGLGNFVAEMLILLGAFAAHPILTAVAALGLVGATIYSLRLIQATFHGPNPAGRRLPDLSARELGVFAAMMLMLVWLGVYPQPVFDRARPALEKVQNAVSSSTRAATEVTFEQD